MIKHISRLILLIFSIGFFSYIPASAATDFGFNPATGTITNYTGTAENVIIPDKIDNVPVKHIGYNAFYFKPIHSVTIPAGVISIDVAAFNMCYNLSNVSIPSSVTHIGNNAFGACAFTSITLPNVQSIGTQAFFGCKSLTSISIPYGVASIQADTFADCSKLEKVIIPETVTSIGDFAFAYCNALSGMFFYGNAPALGDSVFEYVSPSFRIYYPVEATGFSSSPWNTFYQSPVKFTGENTTLSSGSTYITSRNNPVINATDPATAKVKIELVSRNGGTIPLSFAISNGKWAWQNLIPSEWIDDSYTVTELSAENVVLNTFTGVRFIYSDEFKMSQYVLYKLSASDSSGAVSYALPDSGFSKAKVSIFSRNGDASDVTLIIAAYDRNNTLIKFSTAYIEMNQKQTISIGLPVNTGGIIPHKLKAFIVKDMNNLTPISNSVSIG